MTAADPFDAPDRHDPSGPPRRSVAWGRFVPLATLAVLTVAIVAQARRQEGRPPAPAIARGIGEAPPLPPPDDSIALQAVRDEAPISFAETAAYAELLDRVRRTSPEELREQSRGDVVFSDLLARPDRYRGLPIRLQGTARRILRIEDLPGGIAPQGRLFEAWTFTSDSRGFPYVLIFEDPPEDLPGGDDVTALLVFHGYFFKLLAYNAADKPRKAPMLIGRVEYVRDADDEPAALAPGGSRPLWMLAPIALLLVYLFFRATTAARAIFAPSSGRRFHATPRDEISPEELDDWLRRGPDDRDASPTPRGPS